MARLPAQPLPPQRMINNGKQSGRWKVSDGELKHNLKFNQHRALVGVYVCVHKLCVVVTETLVVAERSKVIPAAPAHPLTPLALHCKAESVVSVTSQCSFSSTIVHVGDKKPPESGIENY